LRTVLNCNGEISTVIEAAELAGRNRSAVQSAGNGSLGSGSFLGLVCANDFSTEALTLLQSSYIAVRIIASKF
jgi:hypothetical protein